MGRFAYRFALAYFAAGVLTAAEITQEEAIRGAGNWLRRAPRALCRNLGATPDSATTFSNGDGGPLFHVIDLAEGGYIVTSADSGELPVIAFADSGKFRGEARSPFRVLLERDLAARAELRSASRQKRLQSAKAAETEDCPDESWAALLSSSRDFLKAGRSSVGDVRVEPLVSSRWGQTSTDGYSGSDDLLYNYYTPNHYPCGCVATTGAQIMRYWTHPSAYVTPATYTCYVGYNQKRVSQTMFGGYYNWAEMPLVPSSETLTETQRQAIGKLLFDLGVSCSMWYTADGSAAAIYMLAKRLCDRFYFKQAVAYVEPRGSFSDAILKRGILSNLDAKLPVALGIDGSSGGHALVADGYGYVSGTLYVHLNAGFDGDDDAWYNLPTIRGEIASFSIMDSLVYNILPDAEGEIISGRTLDEGGAPVAGTPVRLSGNGLSADAQSDAHGIFAFVAPGGKTYSLEARKGLLGGNRQITVNKSKSTEVLNDGSFVAGSDSVGNSWGNDITLIPLLKPPAEVSASNATSEDGVTLNWKITDTNTRFCEVWRGRFFDFASAVCLASGLTETTYTDTSTLPGITYTYWIRAVGTDGTAVLSAGVTGIRAYAEGARPYVETPLNDPVLTTKGTFNGYLYGTRSVGTNSASTVHGTLSLKLTKMNGKATLKATFPGGVRVSCSTKAWTSKDADGTFLLSVKSKRGELFTLYLRQNRIWGTVSGGRLAAPLTLDGARDPFADNAKAAATRLAPYSGIWTAAMHTTAAQSAQEACHPYGTSVFSLSVGAKGRTRITGILADGKRFAGSSQLIFLNAANGAAACVPLFLPGYTGKKGGAFALLWLGSDRKIIADAGWCGWQHKPGESGYSAILDPYGARRSTLGSCSFSLLDTGNVPPFKGNTALTNLLPLRVPVSTSGTWSTPKAGKVLPDGTAGNSINPAALKLRYTKTTGLFKGSFYVYYPIKGRIQKIRATVNGTVIDGRGTGSATLKQGKSAIRSCGITLQ